MGDKTGIEWTDATWNPVAGCKHISPGCDHCYAARETSGRLQHNANYEGLAVEGRFTGEIRLLPDRLDQPLRWRKPRRVFVNSMSDLFHADVPDDYIAEVWARMVQAQQHQFQVLTKRPQRTRKLLNDPEWIDRYLDVMARREHVDLCWPLPNVWLGTSIESDCYAFRANHLRDTPAAIRFLSLEPLLGPLPSLDLSGIDWVIVGGESGPGARPMHPDWVRDIRDRCVDECVPFFFKQWGEHVPAEVFDAPTFSGGRAYHDPVGGTVAAVIREPGGPFRAGEMRRMEPGDETRGGAVMLDDDTIALRVGKSRAGRLLDGRTWNEYPA